MAKLTAIQLPNGTKVDIADKVSGYITAEEAPVTDVEVNGSSVVENGVADVTVPTNVSDLANDVGYLTTETDPTVPSWAKQSTKPSYTATEVGALPDDTFIPTNVSDLVNDEGYISSETDPTVPLWAKAPTKPSYSASEVGALPASTVIPSKTSDLTNDSGYITTETDPTVPAWAKSASKPTYTANEVGALPSTTVIPSATSDLTNDSGFITINDVPEEVFVASVNSTTYVDVLAAANDGKIIMLEDDGVLLPCSVSVNTNNISFRNFSNSIEITYIVTATGWTSTNVSFARTTDLAAVATSGSYNDLSNRPTVSNVQIVRWSEENN